MQHGTATALQATEDSQKAVFDNMIIAADSSYDMDHSPTYIIRFRDDYKPLYCRDASGRLCGN